MLVGFRAYVANPLDNSVAVLNSLTGTILARVPTGPGPNSVKLLPLANKVYVTNNASNTVTVIDALTNIPVATITVGAAPADVAVNSTSTRAYVTNSGSNTVSIIDTTTDTVVATVNVGIAPIGVAVSPDDKRVYVANSGSDSLTIINAVNNTVITTIPICDDPRFIDVAPDGRVWVACFAANTVTVFDPNTNTVVASVPVGTGPISVKVNPAGTFAYVANSLSNDVTVVSALGFVPIATIPVGLTPDRIDFDTNPEVATVRAFVTNFGSNTISVIDTSTNMVIATLAGIALTGGPRGIDIGRFGAVESPGEPIDLLDPYVLEEIRESVCIIVDKVYTSCQQRECFPEIAVPITGGNGPFVFQEIKFLNGTIVPETLQITPIPGRPNFFRVRMTIQIQFTVTILDTSSGETITCTCTLPDIIKDIVLFIPPARDEVDLSIVTETRSELLCTPTVSDGCLLLQVGVFVVIKVVGKVQLLVPAFGFCPEPTPCEAFAERKLDVCATFFNPVKTPFPTNFFPPQLEDL